MTRAKWHERWLRVNSILKAMMAGFESQKSDEKKKINSQRTPQNNGEVLLKRAINYHITGDLVNAEKHYREAIDSGLSNVSLYSNLGVICQRSQRSEEAIALYKNAIRINPYSPDAYTNLGSLYIGQGNLDQALASTLKSLELKPDNPGALTNLFNSYGEADLPLLKSTTRRAVELNQGILNDSTYIEALSSLGKNFAKTIITTTESTN